jgi:hypothetical protein
MATMIKTWYLLFFVCLGLSSFAQKSDTYYGVVITKTDPDTTRILYVQNIAGDRLTAYTVRDGLVAEATAYRLSGAVFYSSPILPGQQTKDSLSIAFEDKSHTVMINRVDRYVLFPANYTRFKQDIKVKHSIMALLNLLSDDIGDYPIANALPLITYTPQLKQQISCATIVTQRSQADIRDTWTCNYTYNKYHQLIRVSAASPEETRFRKKVNYNGASARTIMTYTNIESRQTTNRTIHYDKNNHSTIKYQDRYEESGKNRQTLTIVTLSWHDLGMLRKMEPSPAEIIELLKPTKK